MPHNNTWEEQGLYRLFSGVVSGEEILRSNFDVQVDPRFQKIKYIINDFSEVTGVNLDAGHTEIFAKTDDIIANSKGRLKIALLVSQKELLPLAENYKNLMNGKLFECKIFPTIATARDWVGS